MSHAFDDPRSDLDRELKRWNKKLFSEGRGVVHPGKPTRLEEQRIKQRQRKGNSPRPR